MGAPVGVPSSAERTVALGGLVVVALYVVADGVLLRESGASTADHAVGVVVALALLAASAWAVIRARAGARAVVTLVWGVLAIVAGVVDGARHVAVAGLGGDDVFALLALVAGVVLVVVGIVVLVRSRRRDGTLRRRVLRRTAIAVAGLIVGFYVVLPIAFAIVGTHRARSADDAAAFGRDVALRTSDGLRLHATYVPSRNGAAIVVVPGRSAPGQARMLARHGYGVLLLDRRGEGRSEGDANARGWGGVPDVRAAVAWLRSRPEVEPGKVGGLGMSVGGELLLEAAAEDRGLRAVVSEGAGVRSLREQLHEPDAPAGLRWMSPIAAETAATAVITGRMPPPDLADVVARIAPRPVLLIRAVDGNADEALNVVYARRIGPSATVWTVRSGGHTGAFSTDPAAYAERVVGFLDRALHVRRGASSPG